MLTYVCFVNLINVVNMVLVTDIVREAEVITA